MKAPLPLKEKDRIKALREYEILDTNSEQAYDDIVGIASYICDTPIAVISLVDEGRQWFKARIGLQAKQTPREHAFCAHTILEPSEVLVVTDAASDQRFKDSPLVTTAPNIRFYAGAPLVNPQGHALGALCVIDRSPKVLSQLQQVVLKALARQVVTLMELHRVSLALAESLEKVKLLEGLLPICSYCKKIRNDRGYWDALEDFMKKHADVGFTHGICPDCQKKHFPGFLAAEGP